MEEINLAIGNPVIQAELVESNYKRSISELTVDKLLYNPFNNEEFDSLIKTFLINNNRNVPEYAKIGILPGGCTLGIISTLSAIQKIKRRIITVKFNLPAPYYGSYKKIIHSLKFCQFCDYNQFADVEIVVSPLNPTGEISSPTSCSEYIILDSVFDFKMFTGENESVNPWINYDCKLVQISSISKFGFAGTRIGYFITGNSILFELIQEFITLNLFGNNTFSIETFKNIIPLITENSLFEREIRKILNDRQRIVRDILPKNVICSLPTIPFIFVKIPYEYFKSMGIIVARGSDFGVSDEFSRIDMTSSQSDFENFVDCINNRVQKRQDMQDR